MVSIGQLVGFLGDWAGVKQAEITLIVRQLRSLGLLPGTRDAATVDHAIWVLLGLLIGSGRGVGSAGHLPNSEQALNGFTVNAGDPAITVLEGLRDVINLRRASALLTAADFRLVDRGGCFSATIECRVRHPLLGPVSWCFAFGRPVEPSDPDPGFWRVSVLTAEIFDEIANLFGPLQMVRAEPVRWSGVESVPAALAVPVQIPTVH